MWEIYTKSLENIVNSREADRLTSYLSDLRPADGLGLAGIVVLIAFGLAIAILAARANLKKLS